MGHGAWNTLKLATQPLRLPSQGALLRISCLSGDPLYVMAKMALGRTALLKVTSDEVYFGVL